MNNWTQKDVFTLNKLWQKHDALEMIYFILSFEKDRSRDEGMKRIQKAGKMRPKYVYIKMHKKDR